MSHVLEGKRYGRLVFIEEVPSTDAHKRGSWQCDCGHIANIKITRVVNGYTQSCGCLSRDNKPNLSHGQKFTGTYRSWGAMKSRCENPNAKDYPRYGAVGIRVFPGWLNFEKFYRDMGDRPKGTSIDRIDGRKGYEPGNCRWANPIVQGRNKKDTIFINTPIGVKTVGEYAEVLNITIGAAHQRLRRNKLEGCSKI